MSRLTVPDLFRQRNFTVYFAGRTISTFGYFFGLLALTFAVLQTESGPRDLGLVLGAATVPALLLTALGGVAGDRLERRRIVVATDVLMGVTQAIAAVLFLTGSYHLGWLIVLQLVRGTANAFFNPATTGMMPSIVAAGDLQRANATLGLARNAVAVVAPALAGITIALTSPAVALLVDALTYFVSAVLLRQLPKSEGRVQGGASIRGSLREGWHEFSSRPWVWQMVASFAIYQATVLPAILILGPTLAEAHGDGASTWAVVLTFRAIGSILAGALLLLWQPRRPLVASAVIILLDIPLLLAIGFGGSVYIQAAAAVLSSLGVVASDTFWESTLQRKIPEESLSRVSSYDWMGSIAMNPLGTILVGAWAASSDGVNIILAVVAIHLVVHAALLASPQIRSTYAPPESREAA